MSIKKLISRIKSGTRRSCIYHFIDESNLGLINICNGILSKKSLEEKGVTVPFPGGNATSRMSDKMLVNFDNVSLCLTNNHPMAWHCRNDDRHPSQTYIQIKPEILDLTEMRVALGLANSPNTEIILISEAFDRLNLDVLYSNLAWSADVHARLSLAEKVGILFPTMVPNKYMIGRCKPS